jgi:cold shock CspA family protein
MTTTSNTATSNTATTERFTGRVKWFNNKAGYGFITASDGDKSGADIFIHHSSIRVDAEQYKYLVLGEYVEFGLSSVSTSEHEFQASDVTGIKGGKLMCETRHDMIAARPGYKAQTPAPAQTREQTQEKEPEWKFVKKPRQQPAPSAAPSAAPSDNRPTGGRGGRGSSTGGRGRRGSSTGGRGRRGSSTGGRGQTTGGRG